jgi:pantetheine-phosphate adenylyltransferase
MKKLAKNCIEIGSTVVYTQKMSRIALFPGVFDPLTIGHMDIIKRAPLVCEKLIVGIAHNLKKQTIFTIEERLAMLRDATQAFSYVEVVSYSGLSTEYARKRNAHFLLRGLRSFTDYEHESQMAAANRTMNGLETVFFLAEHSHISSSLIQEIAHFGGPLNGLVPKEIEPYLRKKFS